LHFSVRDTGIGIQPDQIDRLFKSFSQVDASTTRKYGGTGLGLAISQRLVELMGGTMWVESAGVPGEGATFHFTIVAQAAEGARAIYLSDEQPQLRGKRVLAVDDNETNRQILTLQMQSWGMQPVVVASGLEALEHIRRGEAFDLAILDMQMPEMDGLVLTEEIRCYRDALALPLILLTSLGRGEAETHGQFAAFLTKPIKASQLYDALIELFAGDTGLTKAHRTQAVGDAESEFDEQMAERLPLRLLLVEDNTTNQKLALLVLQRLGYRADIAANGLEALDTLRHQPYDVVLMDVQMPEMDGLEATRRIRKELVAETQPRIIAMTANAMQGDRELCLAAGMDDYISKPIDVKELIGALDNSRPRVAQAISASDHGGTSTPRLSAEPPEPSTSADDDSPQEAAIDPAALKRLRATLGKRAAAMLPDLIASFFNDAVKLQTNARQAVEQGQAEELRRAAHTLKSNSANFGARALAALCQELESRGKAGMLEGAQKLLAQIETEYTNVRAALEHVRKEL
jgi:CheY-like chemotaxis protein